MLVITADLESRLRAMGGDGGGLGSLTRSLPDETLPIDVAARLQALSGIRNKAVHKPGSVTQDQLDRFLVQGQEMAGLLDQLLADAGTAQSGQLPVTPGKDAVTGGLVVDVRPPMPVAERLNLARLDPARGPSPWPALLVLAVLALGGFYAYQNGLIPGLKASVSGILDTGWMYSAAVRDLVTLI